MTIDLKKLSLRPRVDAENNGVKDLEKRQSVCFVPLPQVDKRGLVTFKNTFGKLQSISPSNR